MSEETVIYGCIYGANGGIKNWYTLYPLNSNAIEKLPVDDEWPPLNRWFFSVPLNQNDVGFYRVQTIHFGASFNNFSDVWNQWLIKFESLLKQMYWFQVKLHLDIEIYGKFDYSWEADVASIQHFWGNPPEPVKLWKFGGGPRAFK